MEMTEDFIAPWASTSPNPCPFFAVQNVDLFSPLYKIDMVCKLGGDAYMCGGHSNACPLIDSAKIKPVANSKELEYKMKQAWVAGRVRLIEYIRLLISHYENIMATSPMPEHASEELAKELEHIAKHLEEQTVTDAKALMYGTELMEKAIQEFIDSDAYIAARDVDLEATESLVTALYTGFLTDRSWIKTLAQVIYQGGCMNFGPCAGFTTEPDENTCARCKVLYELFEARPELKKEMK